MHHSDVCAKIPCQKWIPLQDAARVAMELSGLVELIVEERIWRALSQATLPVLVSLSLAGPWLSQASDYRPANRSDLHVKSGGFVCRNVFMSGGGGVPPEGMFFSEVFLFARIAWAAFIETHFPGANYSLAEAKRRGRPEKHNWAAVEREVGRYLFQNGIPNPQSLLTDHVAAWCLASWGYEPANSLIRERVKSILAYYDQASFAGK